MVPDMECIDDLCGFQPHLVQWWCEGKRCSGGIKPSKIAHVVICLEVCWLCFLYFEQVTEAIEVICKRPEKVIPTCKGTIQIVL